MLDRTHITEHFKWSEFACHDGTPVPQQYRPQTRRLCEALEVLRSELGDQQVAIMSGYRTPEWNRRVKGSARSQHLHARAADIRVLGVSPDKVAKTIERLIAEGRMPQGGLGQYDTFTHYDLRNYHARWDERGRDTKDQGRAAA
jgi:uncharacterized protein YcbK (DUF882 family)